MAKAVKTKGHKESLTITELIAQGKSLDSKISDLVSDRDFSMISYYLSASPFIGARTVEEQESKIKSDMQSLGDMIQRREAIGRARVRANATETVSVPEFLSLTDIFTGKEPGMETITIAEAIWRKDWYEKQAARISSYLNDKISTSATFKTTIEGKAENFINQQMKNRFPEGTQFSQKAYDDALASTRKDNEVVRIDPLNLIKSDSMKKLSDMVYDYCTRINSILSAKNASTVVEFEW